MLFSKYPQQQKNIHIYINIYLLDTFGYRLINNKKLTVLSYYFEKKNFFLDLIIINNKK